MLFHHQRNYCMDASYMSSYQRPQHLKRKRYINVLSRVRIVRKTTSSSHRRPACKPTRSIVWQMGHSRSWETKCTEPRRILHGWNTNWPHTIWRNRRHLRSREMEEKQVRFADTRFFNLHLDFMLKTSPSYYKSFYCIIKKEDVIGLLYSQRTYTVTFVRQ